MLVHRNFDYEFYTEIFAKDLSLMQTPKLKGF